MALHWIQNVILLLGEECNCSMSIVFTQITQLISPTFNPHVDIFSHQTWERTFNTSMGNMGAVIHHEYIIQIYKRQWRGVSVIGRFKNGHGNMKNKKLFLNMDSKQKFLNNLCICFQLCFPPFWRGFESTVDQHTLPLIYYTNCIRWGELPRCREALYLHEMKGISGGEEKTDITRMWREKHY